MSAQRKVRFTTEFIVGMWFAAFALATWFIILVLAFGR
jgi:hypothetical protein